MSIAASADLERALIWPGADRKEHAARQLLDLYAGGEQAPGTPGDGVGSDISLTLRL